MHLLMPLHFFYEKDGRPMPSLEFVQPAAIPGNERELLVHDHDMTSTLEEYHQSPIDLQVVKREASDDYLMRLVVLTKRELPVPVEFGAIGIRLDVFEPSLRAEVLAGQKPLGGLLDQHRFGFISAPSAFFKITADTFIADLLAEPEETILWGRCNSLSTAEAKSLPTSSKSFPQRSARSPRPSIATEVRFAGRHRISREDSASSLSSIHQLVPPCDLHGSSGFLWPTFPSPPPPPPSPTPFSTSLQGQEKDPPPGAKTGGTRTASH